MRNATTLSACDGPSATPHWTPISRLVVVGVVLLGVVFCLRGYLGNRTLFIDEIMLADNLVSKDLANIHEPLARRPQVGPTYGFWVFQKLTIDGLGLSEYTLRLWPLLAAIAALGLFPLVARRFLSPWATILATTAFAFGNWYVYFASQAKPYTWDVLVTLLVLWAAADLLEQKPQRRKLLLLGAVGVLAPWFSMPSIFVLAGVGLALLLKSLARDGRREVFATCTIGGLWLLSFTCHYFLVYAPYHRDPELAAYMARYWQQGFLAFPLRHPAQFLLQCKDLFATPLSMPMPALALAASLLGAYHLLGVRTWPALAITAAVLTAVFASMLGGYPLHQRTAFFLIPLLLIPLAAALDYLCSTGSRRATGLATLWFALMFVPLTAGFGSIHVLADVKPVLERMEQHVKPGDTVYFYYEAYAQYEFYRDVLHRFDLPDVEVIAGQRWNGDLLAYDDDLEQLRGRGRVWIVFSHSRTRNGINEQQLVLAYLENRGKRRGRFAAAGASAYFYDMATTTSAAKAGPTPVATRPHTQHKK